MYIGNLEASKVAFSAPYTKNHKTMVSVTFDDGRKLLFQICEDFQKPASAKYGIDEVRDEGLSGERRGQTIVIRDPSGKAALKALDEAIVKSAVANSKEWFGVKQPLSEEAVRLRYQPIVKEDEQPEQEGDMLMKFKVKVPPAKIPTKMILPADKPGTYRELLTEAELNDAVKMLENRGCLLAPIISVPLLWFMGGGTKFGATLQAEEMVVTPAPPPSALRNFSSASSYEAVKRGAEEPVEALAGDAKKVATGEGEGPASDGEAGNSNLLAGA